MKKRFAVIAIKLKIFYLKLCLFKARARDGIQKKRFKTGRFFHDLHLREYLNSYRVFVLIVSLLIAVSAITYIGVFNSGINELTKDLMINIAAGALWATFLIALVDLGYYVQRVRATQKILRLARISLGSPLYGLKTQMANFLGFKIDESKIINLDESFEPKIKIGEYNASVERQIDDFFNDNQFDTDKLRNYHVPKKSIESYRWQVGAAYGRLERVISLYSNSLPSKAIEPLLELEHSLNQHLNGLKIFDDKKIVADMKKDKTSEFSDAIILVGVQDRFNKIRDVELVLELDRYYK